MPIPPPLGASHYGTQSQLSGLITIHTLSVMHREDLDEPDEPDEPEPSSAYRGDLSGDLWGGGVFKVCLTALE